MARLNKAIGKGRAQEAGELKARGLEPALTHSRWCLLKGPPNLTVRRVARLAEAVHYNLRTVRAYLMRGEFQCFWRHVSPAWAGRFLDQWCARATRSRIEPMKDVARTLRGQRELLLNWFRAKKEFSAALDEGMNNKAKLTARKAYGFRSFTMLQVAPYHTLGELPEPEFTHEFF